LKKRDVRPDLAAGGWPALVDAWRETVESIENGYPLTLDDYLNDMDLRQIIEEASPLVSAADRQAIAELDQRALARLRSVDCLWGAREATANGWTAERNWWYFYEPVAGSE
jgi:hypothetical protein